LRQARLVSGRGNYYSANSNYDRNRERKVLDHRVDSYLKKMKQTEPGAGAGTVQNTGTSNLSSLPGQSSFADSVFERLEDGLSRLAGTEKLEGFSLKDIFSETFRRRTLIEVEDYLIAGTTRTTPPLSEVRTGWPKPWLFARFLVFFALLYLSFAMTYQRFHNESLLTGLLLTGSFAMPMVTLTLFFELNTPRNISWYQLIVLLSFGGVASLFISLLGYGIGTLSWLGASSAGIIEELGKLVALVLIVRGPRYRYMLNGMLFGAAVGAGFGAFESAGEALHELAHRGPQAMMHSIAVRGMLAPLMHVAWTAMVGAALWRVKADKAIGVRTLLSPRFLRVLLAAMLLHMLWNAPWPGPPFHPKEFLLGAVAWFVIWGLVQQGLRQVRDIQREEVVGEVKPSVGQFEAHG
jgi:RsiW-degrading membrane proteinase PrsW (M82 family)